LGRVLIYVYFVGYDMMIDHMYFRCT